MRSSEPLTAADPIHGEASADARPVAPALQATTETIRPVVIAASPDSRFTLPFISLSSNKPEALRDGFRKAAEMGYSHGVTVGVDRRFISEDISKLLDLAAKHPTFLVLGKREKVAGKFALRLGRWLNNLLVSTETTQKISDSLCDLRVYPINLVIKVSCRSRHASAFEIELLVRAAWAGASVVEAPVPCTPIDVEQSSQFKPWVDPLRLTLLHLKLLLIAINPFGGPNLTPGNAPKYSLLRQFVHWLNPLTAWRQVRHSEAARTQFAIGCAAGVFIANLPVYGGQTLLALYTARRFKLHPASTMAGVHISVPPIGPILIAMGIAIGHLILHGSWPKLASYHLTHGQWRTTLFPMLCEWVIGSIVLGVLMGLATFFLMDLALRLIPDPPEAEAS